MTRTPLRSVFLYLVCFLIGLTSLQSASAQHVIDLGTLGGETYAYAINNSGQVVGFSLTATGYDHAFLWQDGKMSDLRDLGGGQSWAAGINASAQVVGGSYPPPPPPPSLNVGHPFLWQNGVMTNLGEIAGPGMANGINASGQVVGFVYNSDFTISFAVLWYNGKMTPLGTLTGVLGGIPNAINDSGQVVGASPSYDVDHPHACLWQSNGIDDLGTLGGESTALAINAHGQVVGESFTIGGKLHAFLWQNGFMSDLNDLLPPHSGWELYHAYGINDRGQIVGAGIHNGHARAFLLTYPTGRVFNPDPITTSGDFSLNALTDPKTLAAEQQPVQLFNLDDSPDKSGFLTGTYADTSPSDPLYPFDPINTKRAYEPTLVFDYPYDPTNNFKFHELMCYYHTDAVHNRLYRLGFGDVEKRQVQLYVDTSLEDNAAYDPDNSHPGYGPIVFGTSQQGADGHPILNVLPTAEDAEVIWHENGHAIQDNQVPGGFQTKQGLAMGEGFADYWAVSQFADVGPPDWNIYYSKVVRPLDVGRSCV